MVRAPWRLDERAVWLSAAVVLAVLVGYPTIRLLERALFTGSGLTLQSFSALMSSPATIEATRNSLFLGIWAVAFCLIIGVPVTWLVTCARIPLRRVFRSGYLVAYLTPSFIFATAYLIALGPQSALNGFVMSLLSLDLPPLRIFSFAGLVLVVTLFCFPFVFLIVGAALENVDPALEEAARVSGAGTLRAAGTVTLPLVAPAIVSAGALVFVQAITLFGAAIYVAAPAGIPLLTTQIYRFMASFPARFDLAAALSLLLLIGAVVPLLVGHLALRRRSFASLGSRGAVQRAHELGAWKWPGFLLCLAVAIVAVVLPFVMIVSASVSNEWTSFPGPGNVTLSHLAEVIGNARVQRASANSLLIAVLTGITTVGLGTLVAYVLARTRVRWRPALEVLAALPLAIPSITLAVGLVLAYISPPVVLYGTLAMFVVAYTTHFVALPVRTMVGTMRQIDPVLEEASRVSGASWTRTFRSVVLPLVRPGLIAAFVLVTIPVLKEFTIAALIFRQPWTTFSLELYEAYETGIYEEVAALGAIFMVSVLALHSLATWLMRGRRGQASNVHE
jgi:iron(III) transport system permease protein